MPCIIKNYYRSSRRLFVKLIKQSVIATNNVRCAWMITLTADKEAKKQVA